MSSIDDVRRELDAHPTWRGDPGHERTRRAVQRRVRAGEEHEFEHVQTTDEGNLFVTVYGGLVFLRPDQVEEVCDLCEEPGTVVDPLGHFLDPEDVGEYVIAHGECGLGCELELA